MKTSALKIRILVSFLAVIAVLSLSIAILGIYVIKKDIIDRAQNKVQNDLNFAWEIYREETRNVENKVRLIASRFFIRDAITGNAIESLKEPLEDIRKSENLDVLNLVNIDGRVTVRARNNIIKGDNQKDNEIVGKAIKDKRTVAGAEIVPQEELIKEGKDLAEQAYIKIVPTLKAKPTNQEDENSGMMIKAASPVFDNAGNLIGVLYGGSLLNRNYAIVDRVKEIVFQGAKYKGKDIGTATIFQKDMRISTNVMDRDGKRAIGTRVSANVAEKVLEKGQSWVSSAFVVNDWYKSAYEPIKNVNGEIIGMLYVGTLEQPFKDMSRNIVVVFLMIIAAGAVLAVILSLFLSSGVSKPLTKMLNATAKISDGELGVAIDSETSVTELNVLAGAFNDMSVKLEQREKSLNDANSVLADLNKRYLDLIGFVAHELKGILATIVMNVYSVKDEYFGAINERQKRALNAVGHSMDYLTATVKKFLSLGKIEKGELKANKTGIWMKKDVLDTVMNSFAGLISRKNMKIHQNVDDELRINGDMELLQIAVNNLMGNAIKYGVEGGNIAIDIKDLQEKVRVEIYNDSEPITDEQKGKLFQRFSRLDNDQTRAVKGTGLGLFIAKEIIEKHGGKIWVEAREKGNSFIFEIEKGLSEYETSGVLNKVF